MMHSPRLCSHIVRLGCGAAIGVLAIASQANAQAVDPQATPPAAATTSSEAASDNSVTDAIVVTGSRIARNGFASPQPVTVVGAERLEQRGQTNVADALNELPSFRALVTPATQQAVGGNIGARVLDLRGLGAPRTLVLLDGKRFVPSTTTGTIDVNLIPSQLISRTEVVTGGASAAYGSDAVAGVVNFILDKNFTGFKASIQDGISQRGDDAEYEANIAYGAHFGEDRGHFIVSAEYDKAKGMGDCYSRSWCPREQVVGNSPAGYGGLPASVRAGPDEPGNLNQDGLIAVNSGPLRGITFNHDGSLRQYPYGQILGTNLSPLFTIGGGEAFENAYLQGILLITPVERFTSFAHADYEFSPAFRANLDLSFGQVKGTVIGSEARGTYTIARNNAYLPAAVAAIMDANGIASFPLGRGFGDLGGSIDHSDNKTYRAVASFDGKISDSWSWDGYYEYGRNEFQQHYTGDVVSTRLTNAVNAVTAPSGSIVCAINADASTANDDPNCVPVNIFGRGNISAAGAAYVAPSGFQTANTTENVVAGNLHGDLFQLPGGALSIASGAEYRNDKLVGTADALSTANAFWSFNGKALNGQIEVVEGYLEAVAPLIKDVTMIHSLELNGAVRRTHYDRSSDVAASSTTNVTTWKLGGVYEPIQELRFRATRSRDIRAPNISELFGPVSAGRVTIVDPANAGQQIQINSLTGSNPNLNPEIANTWTFGAVFSPSWNFLRSFRLSVDYYNINIQGAIATLGAQVVINRCYQGATEFCPFVTRDATNQLTLVQDVLQNVNRQKDRGIDIEASYNTRVGRLGTMDFRLLATHYLEFATIDSIGTTDRVGQTGYRPGNTPGVPDWIVDGFVNWNIDKATFGLHGHYIPKGIFDVTFVGPEDSGYSPTLPNSVNTNRVNARFYLDLNASYKVTSNFEIFGVVNNLLDKDPPLDASAQGGTNQVFFDPIGRYFKVGARVRL